MILKIVTLFLAFIAVLAMFGKWRPRLRFGRPRLDVARCPACGRHRIGKGRCPCGAA